MTRRKDPVTPQTAIDVYTRDQGCVAPRLDPSADPCAGRLTLDHVKPQPMMAKRGPSRPEAMVVVCIHHHIYSGWATSHRPLLREYLRRFERNAA